MRCLLGADSESGEEIGLPAAVDFGKATDHHLPLCLAYVENNRWDEELAEREPEDPQQVKKKKEERKSKYTFVCFKVILLLSSDL